jgi:hypothetical protein
LLVADTDLRLKLVFLLYEASLHAFDEFWLFLAFQNVTFLVELSDLLFEFDQAAFGLFNFFQQTLVLIVCFLLPINEQFSHLVE